MGKNEKHGQALQMACTYPAGGGHFRVYYQYDYPHGTVEDRDPQRFNSLAEAEEFAETMRRTKRIYTNLVGGEKS